MFRGFALEWTAGIGFFLGALFAIAPSIASDEAPLFRVTNVDEWDVLYVREAPSPKAKIIGALPSDAAEIKLLRQRKDEAPEWRRIAYRDIKGWVNVSFLEADPGDERPVSLATRLSCLGTEPAWDLTIADGKALFMPVGENQQLLYTRIPKMAVNRATTWAIEAHDAKTEQSAVFVIRSSGECLEGQSAEKKPYEVFGNFTDGAVVTGCCTPF